MALYKAKTGDRNRIQVAGAVEYSAMETGVFASAAFKTTQVIPYPTTDARGHSATRPAGARPGEENRDASRNLIEQPSRSGSADA